jgi:hypothetical protein
VRPSAVHATDHTSLECPLKVRSSRPEAASHRRTVWSQEEEASVALPPQKLSALSRSVCPLSVRSSLPAAASQSLIVLSTLPEASV